MIRKVINFLPKTPFSSLFSKTFLKGIIGFSRTNFTEKAFGATDTRGNRHSVIIKNNDDFRLTAPNGV